MTDMTVAPRRSRMIFVPFAVLLVVAALWSAFWYFAKQVAERNISAWFEHEARLGRIHSCASRTTGGYPFRIEVRCSDPVAQLRLSPPLVLRAKEFVAVAQVYQPNLIIAEVTGPLSVEEQDQPPMLMADWQLAQMSVRGRPDAPERVSMVLDEARFKQPNGAETLTASRIEFHLRLDPASAPGQPVLDLAARIAGLRTPAGPLARAVDAEATALLRGLRDLNPKPLPVRLREWQAAGGRLEVTRARVQQGGAVATAAGDLGLSSAGRLDGLLNVTMAGFDELVQGLIGGGQNTRNQAGVLAGLGLSLLGRPAELDGKRAVTVPLRFRDGAVSLGPIPLGQTPPLY